MFKHELYKILFNKASIAFIVIIFIVNALQLIWIEDNSYWYPASAYTSIWNDMRERAGDSVEEWQEVYDELQAELQRMRDINILEANTTPAEYTGNIFYEIELYKRVISEIESTLGYEEYLEGIESTKTRFEGLGGLVDKNNYVYRNLIKTAAIYADLEEVTLIPESPAGVKMVSDSYVTDFLALAMFLFFGIAVWLKEKEQGMLNLIRTAKNGRIKLAAAKMGALTVACTLCGTLLYVSNILISEAFYGLGDLSRTIATIDVYRGTLWRISVLEFLVFNLLIKLIAYIWLALLFSVICTGVSGSLAAFGITALMSAGSYVMYTNIPALSAFAVFKYLNPFSIIKTELIFQEFRGLNILGYPFDYRKCVAVVLIVGCLVFAVLTSRLFIGPPVLGSMKYLPKLSGRILAGYLKIRRKFERHVSITGHEFHRIFIAGGITLVVVAGLALQIASYQPYRVRYMRLSEFYQRQYLEELSGPLTDEKIAFIESEQERLKGSADESEQEQRKAINEIAASRLSYLESNKGTYFVYDEPFGLLTAADVWNDDLKLAVVFMVLLALSMPAFFAPEWQTGMHKVVSVTMHGKRKLIRARYIMGIVLTLLLMAITYLPMFRQTYVSYEMVSETFSYPAGSLMHLENFGTTISIGTYLVIVYLLRLVAGVLAALFIYKISAFIKSHIYTMATSFAVLLIPTLMACLDNSLAFVMYPYSAFAGNQFMQSGAAAVTCIMTVVAIAVILMIIGRRRKA